MVQGSGKCHLESVGVCFVGDDLQFFVRLSFAPECVVEVAVAVLYFLSRTKINSFMLQLTISGLPIPMLILLP